MKILHLFDDIMNLYGEYANLRVLERYLSDMGHSVRIDTLGVYEERDITGYDMYFMGAGTERRQKIALAELKKYESVLKQEYENGKVFLFTGNSFELMGNSLTDAQGKTYDCLGMFAFETLEGARRIVGDCLGRSALFEDAVVGFMNKCSKTSGISAPLFTLQMGFGNEADKGAEGICEKNFFGTHLTGPVLIKNPAMLREIATRLVGSIDPKLSYSYMQRGYETTAEALKKRLEQK